MEFQNFPHAVTPPRQPIPPLLQTETSTSAHQNHHELFKPSTPLLHHVGQSAASAWLVPPQAFLLDTSKSFPWLSVNTQTWLNISRSPGWTCIESGSAGLNATPVSTDWESAAQVTLGIMCQDSSWNQQAGSICLALTRCVDCVTSCHLYSSH